jgi:hypothetical protein
MLLALWPPVYVLTHSMINASSVYSMSLIPLIPTQSNFYTNERLNLKEKEKKKTTTTN